MPVRTAHAPLAWAVVFLLTLTLAGGTASAGNPEAEDDPHAGLPWEGRGVVSKPKFIMKT